MPGLPWWGGRRALGARPGAPGVAALRPRAPGALPGCPRCTHGCSRCTPSAHLAPMGAHAAPRVALGSPGSFPGCPRCTHGCSPCTPSAHPAPTGPHAAPAGPHAAPMGAHAAPKRSPCTHGSPHSIHGSPHGTHGCPHCTHAAPPPPLTPHRVPSSPTWRPPQIPCSVPEGLGAIFRTPGAAPHGRRIPGRGSGCGHGAGARNGARGNSWASPPDRDLVEIWHRLSRVASRKRVPWCERSQRCSRPRGNAHTGAKTFPGTC